MKGTDSEILARIEAQIIALDRKVDALIASRSDRPRSREREHDFHQKDKMMHKAVCSECGNECDVPFKPTGNRPIFCSECFAKQQSEDSDSRFDRKPRGFKKPGGFQKPGGFSKSGGFQKPGAFSKPFDKKKSAFQKRKKYDV